jgi:phage gp36-like protein
VVQEAQEAVEEAAVLVDLELAQRFLLPLEQPTQLQ